MLNLAPAPSRSVSIRFARWASLSLSSKRPDTSRSTPDNKTFKEQLLPTFWSRGLTGTILVPMANEIGRRLVSNGESSHHLGQHNFRQKSLGRRREEVKLLHQGHFSILQSFRFVHSDNARRGLKTRLGKDLAGFFDFRGFALATRNIQARHPV